MGIEVWAKTDIGKQRATNEDCHYVDPDRELILVLDGMGGHRAGEVASRLAMETISSFYKINLRRPTDLTEIFENYDHSFSYSANLLRQAAFHANRMVLDLSMENREYLGMGSTVTGMAINGYTVSMINVGDSRMYLVRDGMLEQISRDHTLAEDQVERGLITRDEARESQLRHILSSVVGVDGRIRVHMDELAAVSGDLFLLCSDGLTSVINDDEILSMLLEEGPSEKTIDRFIEEVNRRGAPDNTTIALVALTEDL